MLDLIIVRHAITDLNQERRLQGSLDPPLNLYGRKQASETAKGFVGMNVDVVISSPQRRACETAKIFSEEISLEVTVMEEFRERHYGCIEGLTKEEIDSIYPSVVEKRLKKQFYASPDGAESLFDLSFRVRRGLELIHEKHDDKTVMLVTHGLVARVVYGMLKREVDDFVLSYVLKNCHTERYSL